MRRIDYKENQKVLSNFDLAKAEKPIKDLKFQRIGFSALSLKGRGLLFSGYVPFKTSRKSLQLKLILARSFFGGRGLTGFNLIGAESNKMVWQAAGLKQFKFALTREFGDVLASSVRFWFDELELVGLGYRLTVRNLTVRFRLGYSHVVILPIPKNLWILKRKKKILLYCANRVTLTNFVSRLLKLKRMSAYKVKGLKRKDQVFNLKPGKKRAK